MTQKIIALVDGSIYSASVCDHAAWVAARTGAAVELLHVLGRRDATGPSDLSGAIRLGERTALMQDLADLDARRSRLMAERGRAILEDAQAILTRDGLAEITSRLRHGGIVEAVAEVETDASLLLIGKRGEAADFARGHLGSNLERIVRASHRPVLVASRAFRPVDKVLIAFDGGTSARKAVDHVAQDALFAGMAVHVVTVGHVNPDLGAAQTAAVERLSAAGRVAKGQTVPGHPETALGELVDQEGFGMVVMGAYGHSRIRSLVIGSTTTEMLRSCKVPVLLIR